MVKRAQRTNEVKQCDPGEPTERWARMARKKLHKCCMDKERKRKQDRELKRKYRADPAKRALMNERKRESDRKARADPAKRALMNERERESKRKARADPAKRALMNERERESRRKAKRKAMADPVKRARHNERARESKRKARADPAKRALMNEQARGYKRKARADPAKRARRKEQDRKYYWNKKAQQHWSDPDRWVRKDEQRVKKYLEERFGKVFLFNKSVTTGGELACTETGTPRYPDFTFDAGLFPVIVECDEHEHRGSSYNCDYRRMGEITNALGIRCIFVRYNPKSDDSLLELGEFVEFLLSIDSQDDVEWDPESFDQFAVYYIGYSAHGLEVAARRREASGVKH